MPFLDSINIEKFIESLDMEIPPTENFLQLSKIFTINPQRMKSIQRNPNFERGMLLYLLIGKYRPKNILEIGTSEGYSTLCMAWAMTDYKINGRIFTIDPKPFDIPIKRKISWDDDKINEDALISTKDLWKKFAKKEWIEKIQVLTGYSGEILEKNHENLPKMDMGFIDGHHAYNAVMHDFHAFLRNSAENFSLLFDDYVQNDIENVKKMVDEEIKPNFDVTPVKTNNSNDNIVMCWMQSNSLKQPIKNIFPKYRTQQIIKEYVKWEKRWKFRTNLNKKIPFLGKFRFNH